jgi:putative membrane protein
MAVLLMYNQSQKNKYFIGFAIIAFATGMFTEMIGVNTGLLFGNYSYGIVMGYKIKGVPLLIGVQWLVTVLSSGAIMHQFQFGIENRYRHAGLKIKPILHFISFVLDGAILATFFDFVMEPVAMKLGFWSWQNNEVPNYNYWCWFVISALLLGLYKIMPFKKANQFAIHLFIIQLLFFIALRFFL